MAAGAASVVGVVEVVEAQAGKEEEVVAGAVL